ncbi:penicillin acylase family protein [Myceligenerans salitolerans]|uniref:Penicillin acylase family protein n=2 Tax=Myceligenerans salitolerans TaxID=1230528 RepID=A0ABS3IAJ6_9MICO|nr:penicillin acylase family protein [Myceligenerans salitolerans]MBO0609389.1 penicillin acylase family protein [Myceligenerans salitolerans]
MSRLRKLAIGIAVVVVLVLAAVTTFGWAVGRRALPATSGEVQVEGLAADVRVLRDEQGVPHIYADEATDLFRAQGYVHAQDRFFEMDFRRHVTAGRLAELVGENESAISADKLIRTFGWRQVAEQELDLASPRTQEYLRAYADGVNAYIADRSPSELGVEYTVLGATVELENPEPWDPVDSLAWLKAMAWDLRSNYNDELDRALAYSTLEDPSQVAQLFPDYGTAGNRPILTESAAGSGAGSGESAGTEGTGETGTEGTGTGETGTEGTAAEGTGTEGTGTEGTGTEGTGTDGAEGSGSQGAPSATFDGALADKGLREALTATRDALAAVPEQIASGDEGTGSNSWVVSGQYTETGQPMLANDPHLSLQAPGIWHQVGLHCNTVSDSCPFDTAGFGFSGFPGVVIGHNADIAWGLTNMGADVTDFFIERVRGDTYKRGDQWVDLEQREETIRVNGGSPVDLTIRSTVHGPLISDVLDDDKAGAASMDALVHSPTAEGTELGDYAISLQWTALEPGRTADAVFAFDTARNAEDIRQAAALFDVPAQNIVYATTDGHIGYQAPGRIPVRAQVPGPVSSDGSWPRPGWDARYDWTGYVKPENMPRAQDPGEGFIVAANQAVLPGGSGPYLARDWDYGFRSQRIRTLLTEQIDSGRLFSAEDMSAIQNDDWSPFADLLVPVLLEIELEDDYDSDGQRLLRDWDHTMDKDSAAAAYFAAVWQNLLRATFQDELPESMWPEGGDRWLAVVQGMLDDENNAFWDDKTTVSVRESRDEILTQALKSARQDMTVELSKDPGDWSWGMLHQLELEHAALGGEGVPSLVRAYMNPAPQPVSGGTSIVNATSWDASSGSFNVTAGPSMRMVVDLADLDASTWVTVTGVSGHPASNHYDDQLEEWAGGETFAWPFSREAVEAVTEEELTLRP